MRKVLHRPVKDPDRPATPGGVLDVKLRLARVLEYPPGSGPPAAEVREVCTAALEALEELERSYWGVTRSCPRCSYQVPTQ